ncbi:MAG: PadR family transcriptional regulator [Acidimicrobiales bacterium]
MTSSQPVAQTDNDTVGGVPLLILTSLAAGEKHGHALMKDIERFSGVRLGPGTLYKAMARLEERVLIEALDPDARRRPYRITPAGIGILEQSLDRLGQVVDQGRQRLALANPRPALAGAWPVSTVGVHAK